MRAFTRQPLLSVFLLLASGIAPALTHAAVLGVNGTAFLHGRALDNGTTQDFGTFATSGLAVALTPGGSNSFSTSGGATHGDAAIGGVLNLAATSSSVSGQGTLNASASHTGADADTASYAQAMAGVSGLIIDLGRPGVTFTLSYAFHHDYTVSGAGYSQMFYSANIGTSSNSFFYGSQSGLMSSNDPGAPTVVSGLINGITDSNGNVQIYLDIQPSGGPWWNAYDVSATTWWEFELTTAGATGGNVPTPAPFALLAAGLWLVRRRRTGLSAPAC